MGVTLHSSLQLELLQACCTHEIDNKDGNTERSSFLRICAEVCRCRRLCFARGLLPWFDQGMWCLCVVQERERRKQHATQRAIEAEELQRAKSIVRRQSMVTMAASVTCVQTLALLP